MKIDVNNPGNSTIIYEPTSEEIIGFRLIDNGCEDPYAYIGLVTFGNDQIVNTIDLQTFTESYYCTFNIGESKILGWAGEAPCMAPTPCEIVVDLDGDDSAGLPPWDYEDSVYCILAGIALTDTDATVYSDKPWDSVAAALVAPTGSTASLWSTPVTGITVTGNGTQHLFIRNTADVAAEDLASQLTDLTITADPALLDTAYVVAFIGYADDLVSDTAFSYQYIGDRKNDAGADVMVQLCRGTGFYDLSSDLPDDAGAGGTWSGGIPPDGIIDMATVQSGTFVYTVDDPHCGPDTAVWDIEVEERPGLDLGPDTMLCAGTDLVLTAPTGMEIRWQDGSSAPEQTVTASGWYWLEVMTTGGCAFRDSIFVTFEDMILRDTVLYLCGTDTVSLLGAEYSVPGMYDVMQTGLGGACDTLWMISVEEEFEAGEITPLGTLCAPGIVRLEGPAATDGVYFWSTGEGSRDIAVSEAGTYVVTVTYGDHCSLVDSIAVVDCEMPKYYVPNIFSPNGDGINDKMEVQGENIVRVTLQIFDRWGGALYEETGLAPAWDGRGVKRDAMPGVYVYHLTMQFQSGETVNTAGSVTLVR